MSRKRINKHVYTFENGRHWRSTALSCEDNGDGTGSDIEFSDPMEITNFVCSECGHDYWKPTDEIRDKDDTFSSCPDCGEITFYNVVGIDTPED